MKRFQTLVTMIFTLLVTSATLAADGYVAVDPSKLDPISGKNLMTVAYAVILTIFTVYTGALIFRTLTTNRAIDKVKQELGQKRP